MVCRPSTPFTPTLPTPSLDWSSYLSAHHGWVVARLYMQQVWPGTPHVDMVSQVDMARTVIR